MLETDNRLTWQEYTLKLQTPFHISYGASETRQAFLLRLAGDEGWGEGTIPSYYHISPESIFSFWRAAAARTDPFPDNPGDVATWVGEDGPAPARSAVDLALYDRLGHLRGLPLHQLLNLPYPSPRSTSFTISIDTPKVMARQAANATRFPILKIKAGSDDDISRLAAIRAARPDAELCLDANGAWTREEAVRFARSSQSFGLTFIEQPVSAEDIDGLGYVQSQVDLPIVADESLQRPADLERLAAVGVQGINLKLMKLGGLAPTLSMIEKARSLGMRIMLGCMIETSLGTTAMAHLSGMADWLDLDAPLLIANDPFSGLYYDDQARIHLPDRPGIGVELIVED